MNERRRIGAALLCALLALALLVSSAFMLHAADHDCTGEDCPVCRAIARAESLLRLLGAVLAAEAALRAAPAFRPCGAAGASCAVLPATPVRLKIRIND